MQRRRATAGRSGYPLGSERFCPAPGHGQRFTPLACPGACRDRHRLALAVGARDHPLGRQGRTSSRRSSSWLHSLATGQSPFWAPFAFSGHPQIADPQAMIFSPPFLALALDEQRAQSLGRRTSTVLAMVFLGGAALMLWFRDQDWHWAGALIAALAFGYGASMAWRIQHIGQVLSLAYLPIAMLCLDRALARRSILYGIAAGLVAACIVLGRDQVALLSIYLLIGLAAWRIADRRAAAAHGSARACLLPVAGGALWPRRHVAIPVMLIGPAGRGVQPRRHRLHRRRARLAASRAAAHPRRARGVRRLGAHGGLLGTAELRLARQRHLPRAEHGPALHRRHPADPAADGGRCAASLWAPEVRFFTVAAVVALLYALGWYTPAFRALLRAAAGRRPVPAPRRRNVPHRRADGHPCRLQRTPAVSRTRWPR